MSYKKTRKTPTLDHELNLYVFANSPESIRKLESLNLMIHDAVFKNQLGMMEVKDAVTDELKMALVGLQFDESGKAAVYPLAIIVDKEEVSRYLAPDGRGGYGKDEVNGSAS